MGRADRVARCGDKDFRAACTTNELSPKKRTEKKELISSNPPPRILPWPNKSESEEEGE